MVTRNISRTIAKVPLRIVLIVPFILQIVGAVGLVGYLSLRNGQQAVNDVTSQLRGEISDRVQQYLDTYLATPHLINQINIDAVRLGQLNLQDLPGIERHLFSQLMQFNSVTSIIYGNELGELRGIERPDSLYSIVSDSSQPNKVYVYTLDNSGNRKKLLNTVKIDVRQRPWYQKLMRTGKPGWSEVFQVGNSDQLAINAYRPIQDHNQNRIIGGFSVNLFLVKIGKFLDKLKVGKSGEVFIIERSGLMIASSTSEQPFIVNSKKEFQRLPATNSSNALISATSRYLTEYFGDFTKISFNQQLEFIKNGERQFVQVVPFRDEFGLDWLIVVVVPEADFMERINAHTYTTILLCAATLIVSTGIGIITARWITKPILRLNTAAKEIAQGNLDKKVEIKRSDEVGELAKSFNRMAAQLQTSFAALKESENRLTQFLEALPVGVSVHDATGRLSYANPVSKQIMGIDTLPDAKTEQLAQAYHVYHSGTQQLYPVEQMPIVKALSGESITVEDMELHHRDRIIPLEVRATPIYNETGEIVSAIAALIDITERQQVQQILADYNHTLEAQVVERTAKLVDINEQLKHEVAERKQAEKVLQDSALREQAIAHVLQRMRQTLTIDAIFSATTEELRQVLNCERVAIYRFNLDWSGEFVAESVANGWIPLVVKQKNDPSLTEDVVEDENCVIKTLDNQDSVLDTYLQETQGGIYTQGVSYQAVEDIYNAGVTPCYINLLEKFQARAYIIVPIFCSHKLWGLLATYQNSGSRSWSEGEISVVVQIGTQMGIALQQAQLLEETKQQAAALKIALNELKRTQTQLIQSEKMSSLGQMVAGIAHEINNPVSFIQGNLTPAHQYFQDLIELLELYQQTYPNSTPEIDALVEEIDLEFLVEDWSKLMDSMLVGTQRIRDIVLSLRNFSRLDEEDLKPVDIHEGIENTLLILQHRLRAEGHSPEIDIVKNYGQLPLVTCYAGQLNQVFMNILSNAIDALANQPESRKITIRTSLINQKATSPIAQFIVIKIADNGSGMTEDVRQKIFDPFFTTKPVGSGTGLGLSISYQIVVDQHQGKISCSSTFGQGTEFIVEIPVTCQVFSNPPDDY